MASSDMDEDAPEITKVTPAEFVANLERNTVRIIRSIKLPKTIREIESLGLPSEDAACLREELAKERREDAVVMAYLYALSASSIGHLFGRSLKRAILKAWKDSGPEIDLDTSMRTLIMAVSATAWSSDLLVASTS
jgi:hypothetical protein